MRELEPLQLHMVPINLEDYRVGWGGIIQRGVRRELG